MKPLRYAWNTNGSTYHRLPDIIELIAEAGYDGLALTLDWHHLDPFALNWEANTRKLRQKLDDHNLGCIIKTNVPYLLNPRKKNEPSLVYPEDEGRALRIRFLRRAVDIAARLNAEAVSFQSGKPYPDLPITTAYQYLKDGINELQEYAQEQSVIIALEPEPGMLIETNRDYEMMSNSLNHPLFLALNAGHVWATGEMSPEEAIRSYAGQCGTAAIEGMNQGVHEHLPLHQGDMDVASAVNQFQLSGFNKLISVELSQESHRAHRAIVETIHTLRNLEQYNQSAGQNQSV